MEYKEFFDNLRGSLKNHILADDNVKQVVSSIEKEQLIVIQTAEKTSYSVITFAQYLEKMPEKEIDRTNEYFEENKSKTIIGYQENGGPIILFSYAPKTFKER